MPRGEVCVHLSSAAGGIVRDVPVRVQLRKKFLNAHHAQHEHPGLVTVITGTPVTFLEGSGYGELGDLFSIAENAELCLAA